MTRTASTNALDCGVCFKHPSGVLYALDCPTHGKNRPGQCVTTGSVAVDTVLAQGGAKYDGGKERFSLLPGFSIWEVVRVLEFGAKKYAPHSWQTVPNAFERYADALQRHFRAFESEDTDADSSLSHLAHLACNALFLCWLAKYRPEQVEQWRKRCQ